eukprot:TRINITY_DN4923_c0_g1_i1.p2 TRINITY_DN4923_c0_g1~~TRINITY_DN4923_c0_g1_i1.p2  ORF type:complete len:364 (+),score=125.26 TRINITY_DN4923_c0_g1_i1:70-1161(+)
MSKRLISGSGNIAKTNLYGQVTTIFGNYGTVGLGISHAMAAHGNILVLPYHRSGHDFRQAQLAACEQWNYHPVFTDFNKPAQLRENIEPADHVVVCLGREPRPNLLRWRDLGWGHDALYRQLPVDIAKMCAETGKETMVYISRIGADINSESSVFRAHARAEMEIREIMPSAIIIRPSDVFTLQGSVYRCWLRHLAKYMNHKSVPGFDEMFNRVSYPINSSDVGVAVAHAVRDPQCWGKTFEIGGRQRVTFKETMQMISNVTSTPNDTFRMPFELCKMYGTVMEMTRWDTAFTKDYFVQKQYNSIPNEKSSLDILGWEELGVDKNNLVLMEEIMADALYNFTARRNGGMPSQGGDKMDIRFTF